MRIKGESVEEIAGFLAAAEASFTPLHAPAGPYAPVVLPSYNGSRKMANLTPLLCMLLVRRGVPVLMHGVTHDPQRVTSAEIFSALGVAHAGSAAQAEALMAAGQPAFIPIAALAPPSPPAGHAAILGYAIPPTPWSRSCSRLRSRHCV
jgi:anthranilate phosphoribosyltransferase